MNLAQTWMTLSVKQKVLDAIPYCFTLWYGIEHAKVQLPTTMFFLQHVLFYAGSNGYTKRPVDFHQNNENNIVEEKDSLRWKGLENMPFASQEYSPLKME